MTELYVQSNRGDALDTVHRVHVAVCRADGSLVATSGDPGRVVIMRSAAKPFQALPLAEDGVVEHFDITPEELALACASHNSEVRQVEIVRGFLGRIGLSEQDLACGPHPALARDFTVRPPESPSSERPELAERSRLASNCSGKHTGMLALALHHGWETQGYRLSGHPVQQRVKRALASYADLPETEIGEGVDGCGVVAFSLPLASMARALARLATDGGAAAQTVARAMTTHPDLVAGRWRLDTELMQAYARLIVKVGAEGVHVAAVPEQGIGVALKVEDGSSRAAMPALVHVLDQLGLDPAPSSRLARFATLEILNTRAEPVGAMHAAGALTLV
jgi:L-asparaginase II